MSLPQAKGRYLCAHRNVAMRELVALLKTHGYDGYPLPKLGMDCAIGDHAIRLGSYLQPKGVGAYLRTHVGRVPKFDNAKIRRELEVEFRDVQQTILETVEDLKRWGHVGPPGA